jgi:CubicO group peptidase (beta-lactamase class C family)
MLYSIKKYLILSLTLLMFACGDENPEPETNLYFPPTTGSTWQTTTPESLGWDASKIPDLLNFMEDNNTKAFIVLKDGKIVIESYFGNGFTNMPFTATSNWYWASAGKTLAAFMIGKAQEDGFLDINDVSADYLGAGWTSLTPTQENAITIWHQLTMTSGLNDGVSNSDCTDPECLEYLASPSTRWAYHNAPYTLLDKVVENAVGQDFDAYFNAKLRDKIGMDGFWLYNGNNHVYYSTARSMARFGLLILNRGKWDEQVIMSNADYFEAMTNTSQNINPSYGYLWWLNGKSSFKVPGFQTSFSGSVSPQAPADLIAAMGKNGQLVNVVPSQNLIVIRMGDVPDNSLVPFLFQDDMWEQLNLVID